MRQRGFTLLEMIVVLVILGLAAGIIVSRGALRSDRLLLAGSARSLADAMRLARARAIATSQPVGVTLLPGGYSIDQDGLAHLPAGQALQPGRVVFTPDGQATGGTVTLRSAAGFVPIMVNWLTGQVRFGPYQAARP